MNRTYFGRSLRYHLMHYGMTQLTLSSATKLRQSSISQLISKPNRPDAETLHVLCNCWPDKSSNLRILIEHMRDEMVRAGHDPEHEIDFRPIHKDRQRLEADLGLLTESAFSDSDVAALVRDLATLIRRARAEGEKQK